MSGSVLPHTYYDASFVGQSKRELYKLPKDTKQSKRVHYQNTRGDITSYFNKDVSGVYTPAGGSASVVDQKWLYDIQGDAQLRGYVMDPITNSNNVGGIHPAYSSQNIFGGTAGQVRNLVSRGGPVAAFNSDLGTTLPTRGPRVAGDPNNISGVYNTSERNSTGLWRFPDLDPTDPLSWQFAAKLQQPRGGQSMLALTKAITEATQAGYKAILSHLPHKVTLIPKKRKATAEAGVNTEAGGGDAPNGGGGGQRVAYHLQPEGRWARVHDEIRNGEGRRRLHPAPQPEAVNDGGYAEEGGHFEGMEQQLRNLHRRQGRRRVRRGGNNNGGGDGGNDGGPDEPRNGDPLLDGMNDRLARLRQPIERANPENQGPIHEEPIALDTQRFIEHHYNADILDLIVAAPEPDAVDLQLAEEYERDMAVLRAVRERQENAVNQVNPVNGVDPMERPFFPGNPDAGRKEREDLTVGERFRNSSLPDTIHTTVQSVSVLASDALDGLAEAVAATINYVTAPRQIANVANPTDPALTEQAMQALPVIDNATQAQIVGLQPLGTVGGYREGVLANMGANEPPAETMENIHRLRNLVVNRNAATEVIDLTRTQEQNLDYQGAQARQLAFPHGEPPPQIDMFGQPNLNEIQQGLYVNERNFNPIRRPVTWAGQQRATGRDPSLGGGMTRAEMDARNAARRAQNGIHLCM